MRFLTLVAISVIFLISMFCFDILNAYYNKMLSFHNVLIILISSGLAILRELQPRKLLKILSGEENEVKGSCYWKSHFLGCIFSFYSFLPLFSFLPLKKYLSLHSPLWHAPYFSRLCFGYYPVYARCYGHFNHVSFLNLIFSHDFYPCYLIFPLSAIEFLLLFARWTPYLRFI